MDYKARWHKKVQRHKRHNRQNLSYYVRACWKFLQAHRSAAFTCFLLAMLCVLLFALAARLPVPETGVPTNGAKVVDYTTFLRQIQAKNVEAVAIQGDDVRGLLKQPFLTDTAGSKQDNRNTLVQGSRPDATNWMNAIANDSSTPSMITNGEGLTDQYTMYTHIPAGGKDLLMTQLDETHALVEVLPVQDIVPFIAFILRSLPIIFVVALMIFFFARQRQQNPLRSMDQQVSKLGEKHTRLFGRLHKGQKDPHASSSQRRNSVTTPQRKRNNPANRANSVTTTSARITEIPTVTFADVAGIDEVRTELAEIVQFLRAPEKFNRLGAHIPHGALLVGAPGTGKTLLAKAVAGEAQVPFFSISASEFVEMFVGVGASRVRDLFQQARQVAPCVVFIDELDAVGRKRSARASSSDERDQTLNQLLVELDGFDERQSVVLLAATNRVDILDQALLRPGRFDRRIMVSAPDRVGREAILRVHSRHTPLAADVSLERLARLTTGMTGADLANLINEAALSAARQDLDELTHDCFEDALSRIQLGALRPLVMSEAERRVIAIHEGGHALVAYHLPEADSVNRVTILPRGQSLGVTQFSSEVDRYNYSRENLMTRIAVGLGGRMAEELTFGRERITTGAENDLQVVTKLAHKMVTRWGMSEHVGVVFADYRADEGYSLNLRSLAPAELTGQSRSLVADAQGNLYLNGSAHLPTRFYAQAPVSQPTSGVAMNTIIDAEMLRILTEGQAMARTILTEHCDQLTLLADALIEHEQLDRHQFESLLHA